MSKNAKIILGVVIIIAIALIAWCYFGTAPAGAPTSAPVADQSQNQQVAASNVPVSGLTTSSSDSSNAALNSDMSAMSTQSSAMDQDSAAAQSSGSTQ
jgi:predicted negative regulator of RcsB-dependent stress response